MRRAKARGSWPVASEDAPPDTVAPADRPTVPVAAAVSNAEELPRRGPAALVPDLPAGISACLFDLDGVLTQTAKVHAAAWKEMFDAFLREHASLDAQALAEAILEDGRAFARGDVADDCAIVCLRLAP